MASWCLRQGGELPAELRSAPVLLAAQSPCPSFCDPRLATCLLSWLCALTGEHWPFQPSSRLLPLQDAWAEDLA